MNKKIRVYLIRHARQNSTLCNVNVELSKEGYIQSQLLAKRLYANKIDFVYSSNLIRAMQTAKIIRKGLHDENDIVEQSCSEQTCFSGLREIDYGLLTGLTDEQIKTQFKSYLEQKNKMIEDVRIPGGENGEEVFNRMKETIDYIVKQAARNNYQTVAVVSHGGAIRCYLAGILNIPQRNRYIFAKTMENTSITEILFEVDKSKKIVSYSIERLNDYSHLEGHEELLRKTFK